MQQEVEQQETLPSGDDVAIREVRQVKEVVKRIATVRPGKKRSRGGTEDMVEEELDAAMQPMHEEEDLVQTQKVPSAEDRQMQVQRRVVVEEEDDGRGVGNINNKSGAATRGRQKAGGQQKERQKHRVRHHANNRKRIESYKRYIFKILKQIHPDLGISSHAMSIMQTFISDHFDRIVTEAARLTILAKKSTLSAREIQTAVRLILPGALRDHAVKEGNQAVARTENVRAAY